MIITFIGDKPSKKNTNAEIAFEGTLSGKTLDKWISFLDLNPKTQVIKINSVDETLELHVLASYLFGDIIVTLGKESKRKVDEIVVKSNIKNLKLFELPHPSPRNRKLNDKEYVQEVLTFLKKEVHGK